jgi:hypothetical protein
MQPRSRITEEVLDTPEILLGIAALLVFIVGAYGQSAQNVVAGLIMGASAVFSYKHIQYPLLKGIFAFFTISAVLGVLFFVGSIETIGKGGGHIWTTWVMFVASFLSLFAAYRAVVLRRYE